MTVSIDIEVAARADGLVIPAAAVRELQSRQPWVLVVRDGRAARQPVQLGARTAEQVEVLSGLVGRRADRHDAGHRAGRARAPAVIRGRRNALR